MVDGYYALAASLTALFGQPDAAALKMGFLPNELPSLANVGAELTRGGHGPVPMLVERTAAFTQLTNGLGRFYSWNSLAFIEEAKGSAVRLALLLARTFDLFDDVTVYKGHAVRFFKRAQIGPAICMGLLAGKGGSFPRYGVADDLCRLQASAGFATLRRAGLQPSVGSNGG